MARARLAAGKGLDSRADLLFGKAEPVVLLQVHPELGARPKVAGEAQSRVSRNRAGAMQDTRYPVGRYLKVTGQLRGRDSQGSDGVGQVFPGMDGSARRDSPQSAIWYQPSAISWTTGPSC